MRTANGRRTRSEVRDGETTWWSRKQMVPAGPSDETVADMVSFAEAATRIGCADPARVDDYLRQGSNAFLGEDYRAAFQIFRALLIPIGNVDIDLGQHEMVDEVLGVDVAVCAAQYVVSMYMTATPPNRGKAVLAAIDDMQSVSHFWEPLRAMESVAVGPLPGIDEFLPQWRALVEQRASQDRDDDWDTDADRWLREVVGRMDGADGLARLAHSTRRGNDLRAWCRALVEARDWKAALAAYEEAAELVTEKEHWRRGGFLDGAALAAQELGRKDLPSRLKRAWQEAPTMVRLCRWLGSSNSKKVLCQRADEALEACPQQAQKQRALLHVFLGDIEAAAKLLASAPGLGWSNSEHPGHLIFSIFCGLLGGSELMTEDVCDVIELGFASDQDEPRLATPEVAEILKLAGVTGLQDGETRTAALFAMRAAAKKRIAALTKNKRRRHYGHAASLALACVQHDPTPDSASWLAAIRDEYRRYPALQRELGASPRADDYASSRSSPSVRSGMSPRRRNSS